MPLAPAEGHWLYYGYGRRQPDDLCARKPCASLLGSSCATALPRSDPPEPAHEFSLLEITDRYPCDGPTYQPVNIRAVVTRVKFVSKSATCCGLSLMGYLGSEEAAQGLRAQISPC